MLFNKKSKGVINAIWTVVAVLIIASMILLYFPVFR
jgi:hypothetical protein